MCIVYKCMTYRSSPSFETSYSNPLGDQLSQCYAVACMSFDRGRPGLVFSMNLSMKYKNLSVVTDLISPT